MKNKYYFIIGFIGLLLPYFACAFVTWQLDASLWDAGQRSGVLLAAIFSAIILPLFAKMISMHD